MKEFDQKRTTKKQLGTALRNYTKKNQLKMAKKLDR